MNNFNYDAKLAITCTDGLVELWHPDAEGRLQVFKNRYGTKAVLRSDDGAWWAKAKKDAPFCEWARTHWFGSFPHSSKCFAARVCKVTGEFQLETIPMSINQSVSDAELWERECKSYVPTNI